jgi:hypothetical protein
MRFAGKDIFGSQVRQNGPIAARRAQRETLPGVKGFREYQTTGPGPDTRTWTVTGRIVATTLGALQNFISNSQALIGTFGTFEETGGTTWRNCQLKDYRPQGAYQAISLSGVNFWTVEIAATVETAS